MSRIFFVLLVALLTLPLACTSAESSAIPLPKPATTLAPTSTPTAAPTIDRMTEYRAQMISLAPRLPEVAERLSQRLIAPAYDNRYWVLEVQDLAAQLVGIYEETLSFTPPPSLETVHASFVLGMKHYAEASSLLSDGLASAERGDNMALLATLSEVREQMALAKANFTYATQLMQGGDDISVLAIPTIPPRLSLSTTTHTPKSAQTRELEPVPTFPSNWIATAESDSVMVYLGEQTSSAKWEPTGSDGGETKAVSRAYLTIENVSNSVVRVGPIWLKSVPDCYPRKGRSIGVGMEAWIVADGWLNVSGIPRGGPIGGFSQRTFFREPKDVWAKEYTDEFGMSNFEVFPKRWIRIFAQSAWSPDRFGECVQLSFEVAGKRITMPLPRP